MKEVELETKVAILDGDTTLIERTSNGVKVRFDNEEKAVFKFDEEDLEGLTDFMWRVIEHFAPCTSRYSKERISVKIVHGDKYECHGDKCGVCKEEKLCGGRCK